MKSSLLNVIYEVELQPGEKLTLPESLVESIGPGRWIITIQPVTSTTLSGLVRSHRAFLNSYAPEDEGLYDDYPSR